MGSTCGERAARMSDHGPLASTLLLFRQLNRNAKGTAGMICRVQYHGDKVQYNHRRAPKDSRCVKDSDKGLSRPAGGMSASSQHPPTVRINLRSAFVGSHGSLEERRRC